MSKRDMNRSLHNNFFSFQRFPEETGHCLHLYSAFIQTVLLWLWSNLCFIVSTKDTSALDRGCFRSNHSPSIWSKHSTCRAPAATQRRHKRWLITAVQVQPVNSDSISAFLHTWLGQTWGERKKREGFFSFRCQIVLFYIITTKSGNKMTNWCVICVV